MNHFGNGDGFPGGASPHVCFFPGELNLGGVGRNTLNLAEELLQRDVKVDFFLSRRAGSYMSKVPAKVRIIEGGGSVRASVLHLIRYLRHEQPDLLVSARPYINLAALFARDAARSATKVVITERTSTVVENRLYDGVRRRVIKLGCRLLYPRADHIVAVSESVAQDVVAVTGLARDRIEVIYNPVVTDRIDELSRARLDDPWVAQSPGPVVLGAGRLTLQKDFPTLLRAFAEVRKEVDARLVVLGEGEDRVLLESLARELRVDGYVHLPGYAENPFVYMARASVFVLSSAWEGLPTALIEALATGTAVVSTDCPGGSREILAGGEYGELVPVGDVAAMARAIRSAIARPPSPEALRERALYFSAAKAADRYLALLEP